MITTITAKGGRGFTLIEVLVALVIMGLFAGLVTVIVRPDERALLRVEAERLAQLLDLAGIEARISGKPIAWTADGPGYRFWRYRENAGWLEIRGDGLLRARTLPQGMTIASLLIETMRVRDAMRLEFSPQGSTMAYVIKLALGAEYCTVAGSPVGEVRVLPEPDKANSKNAPQ
ncbi:general secretion pathway protein H [Nitrosospira sp. Nsp5]|uniref:Type II secretion system protein H n=1 Tax=Nitrosospira multiformis TaxID=1231 RepID=A0ABY0TIH8_9PROT|nr:MULTISPECIES: GspH/FimT family pseudopilin [Nitrosospira]PTR06773.1 general secretion pathway protein H [Nitrosospira sp. Nsp5]SDQ87897.1 general secretion pathway protein H [Nitrosospira multiformis]